MAVEKTKSTTVILFAFRCIPGSPARGSFTGLFLIFYHLGVKNRLIALHNLQRSFPEKDAGEIIRIAKGVYRHFAIVAAEFFDMPRLLKRISINGWMWKVMKIMRRLLPREGHSFHCRPFWKLGTIAGRHTYLRQTDVYCLPSFG